MAVRHFLIPLAIAAGAVALVAPGAGRARGGRADPRAVDRRRPRASEVAIFAGGCFWGVEGVFEHVRGVSSAVSGYTGGKEPRPTYEAVSAGRTGHAEAVRVTYDPRVVRYSDLLRIYFSVVADPTQLNRQGPDTGTQYRTALFPTSAAQERQARAYIAQLGKAAPVRQADRDEDRKPARLRAGGDLSPGLHAQEPQRRLHRRPRPPQGRSAQAAVPEELPRLANSDRSYVPKFPKVSG